MTEPSRMGGAPLRMVTAFAAAVLLAGCGALPDVLRRDPDATRGAAASATLVERDVEAPEVFKAEERALWDGRPSLGGIWVAAPGVTDPERVVIRNPENGSFVIGALFRREEGNPGPRLQLSSGAAEALGVLAGRPTTISVVALRLREVEEAPPATADAPSANDARENAGEAPAVVTPLLDATPASADAAAPAVSDGLAAPHVRVAVPAAEAGVGALATTVREARDAGTVRRQGGPGRTSRRVVLGPTATEADRSATLREAVDPGFADAYPVRG